MYSGGGVGVQSGPYTKQPDANIWLARGGKTIPPVTKPNTTRYITANVSQYHVHKIWIFLVI